MKAQANPTDPGVIRHNAAVSYRKIHDEVVYVAEARDEEPDHVRVRMFTPMGSRDSNSSIGLDSCVYLILSLPHTPDATSVPSWLMNIVAQLRAVAKSVGNGFLAIVHYPDRQYLIDHDRLESGAVGDAFLSLFEETHRELLEAVIGESLDSPEPTAESDLPADTEPAVTELSVIEILPTDQVYSFTDAGGGEWHWNASLGYRLIELARQRGFPREVMAFHPKDHGIDQEHLKRRYPDLDEDHARTVDITRPILFVPFEGGKSSVLVDGWHRLLRCVTEGVESLPCYQLTQQEADIILIHHEPATAKRAAGDATIPAGSRASHQSQKPRQKGVRS